MAKASLTIAIGGEYNGKAIDKAEKALRDLNVEAARHAGGMTESFTKAGDSIVDFGNNLQHSGDKIEAAGMKLTKLTAPLTAIGAASVKMAADYDAAVAKTYTIMDKQVMSTEQMSKNILDLSTATGKGAKELADAAYQALSASVETSKVGGFVEDAAKLSKAGFTETKTAVDTLTTVINAYKMRAEDASLISDKLVQTQNDGKTTVDELGASLGNIIPTAAALNVNLDNVLSSYALMTKQGISTAESTTALKGMLSELSKDGSNVAKVLRAETGKSFGELMADGRSLSDVLQVLYRHANGNGEAFKNLFSNVRAGTGALALVNAGAEAYADEMSAMQSATGNVASALDDLATPAAKFNKALNALKNTGIELGEEIMGSAAPTIDGLAEKAQGLYKWFSQLDDGTKQNIVRFGALAVAAGPVVAIFGKGVKMLGSFTSSVGHGMQSIGAFTAAMKTAEAEMAAAGNASATMGAKIGAAAEKTGIMTKATTLLKGSLAMLGTSAVIALVGIIIEKYTEWAEHTDMVAKATEDLVSVFESAEGEFSGTADAVEAAAESMSGGADAVQDNLRAMGDLNDETRESVGQMKAAAAQADYYADVMASLAGKGDLTSGEQAKLANAVSEYNKITGANISVLDQQAGALDMSKTAILESTDAWKKYAEAQAYTEIYSKYTQKMTEDSLSLEQATKDLNEADRGFGIWLGDFPVFATEASVKYHDLAQGVRELEAAQDGARRTAEAALKHMEEGAGLVSPYQSSIDSLAGSMGGYADATEDAEAASEAFQNQLDAQYKAQQRAYDDAYKAMQKSLQAEEKALQKSHTAQLKETQKALDAQYDALDKKLDKRYENLKSKLEKEEEALKASNDERLDTLKKSQEAEVKAFEKATEAKLKLMEKEYKASVKNIEAERDARVKAIDDQIAALEAEDDAAEKAAKETEREQKKAELEKAVNTAKSSTSRARAEKELSDYLAQIAEEDAKERRKEQIERLKDSKATVKEEADARKETLKTGYDEEKEAYKESRDAQLEAIKEANTAEYDELERKLDAQEKALSESHDRQLESLKDANDARLKAMKEDHDAQLEAIRDANSGQEEALRDSHATRLEDMRRSQQDQLASLKQSQKEQLEAFKAGNASMEQEAKDSAEKSGENVKDAIDAKNPDIQKKVENVKDAVMKFFSMTEDEAGKSGEAVGGKFGEGIESKEDFAGSGGGKIGKAATDSLKAATDGSDTLGSNFATGFSNGMGGVDIWTAAWNIGASALGAIKSALGIASPSKEAKWVGEMYGKGIAIGMGKTEREIEAQSLRLTDAMTLEPTPYGTFAVPGSYQPQYARQQAPPQFEINMTIYVTARSEEEAVAIGRSYGEGLYEEFARRERQFNV